MGVCQMKKRRGIILWLVLISVLFVIPAFAADDAGSAGEEILQEGSEMLQEGSEMIEDVVSGQQAMMEKANALLATKELDKITQAISIYEEILKNDPDDFEATWHLAKAYRDYGYHGWQKRVSGWEDNCAKYGKLGMKSAQKAISLEPEKVQGYYFYALSVGVYSDGVGIFTALREGLKDKTQENLETAYKIDKGFDKGGPILGLGRFWQKVPWPYHDEDKAMKYYRELMKSEYFGGHVEHYIYPAEILMDQWGSEPKKEARSLLKKAINSPIGSDYWKSYARQLLADL